jgi:DNA-binding transcriptional regulator YiaG
LITSKQQKNRVLKQIGDLQTRLAAPAKAGVPAHMAKVSKAQLRDRIASLQAEVAEFDEACRADIHSLAFDNLPEMFKLPIKVRLATGQSIPDFARKINVSPSTLKRYEALEYANAPAEVLQTILNTYGLTVSGHTSEAA